MDVEGEGDQAEAVAERADEAAEEGKRRQREGIVHGELLPPAFCIEVGQGPYLRKWCRRCKGEIDSW